jgi:hypothetical protein
VVTIIGNAARKDFPCPGVFAGFFLANKNRSRK